MNVKITILDSIVDEVRKGSCFKVLKSFYSKVISCIYGFKKLETILNENINDIQAFQKNGYDCGAFSICSLVKSSPVQCFLSTKSIFPPKKRRAIVLMEELLNVTRFFNKSKAYVESIFI